MKWLIVAVLVLAQQPPKAPESNGPAKGKTAQNAQEAQASNEEKNKPAPPQIQQINAQNPQGKAAESGGDVTIERRTELFTGLLVLVGFLQAGVMFLQWSIYRRQAGIMEQQRATMQSQWTTMQGQLAQMESAGKQTERIIENASKQVGLMEAAGEHTEQLASQAVRQSDITQRQLDLANRPWVCLDSVVAASDFTFKDSGEAVIFFRYQIRNVGHSVAQHLQPWIEPIVSGVHNPLEVEERISAILRKPVDSVFDHGKLIFPSQVIVDAYPVLIRKEVIEEAIKNSPFKASGDKQMPCFGLELFVCFDYQSTLDPTIHHQTQSMYIVTHSGMGIFYPSQRVYKANEISVGYKGYGAYAD